ncbi:MAG: hypothetical protein Q9168_004820 [Polycauliona sp. 1 TL-2023]
MRPLRLQIVVQPRVLPSPANPLSSKEPVIKWLEVCTGDPTIQELSETLEKRFLQRNHTNLNIKILKFLDDVELFPDYKVRDIFEDVKDAKQGHKDLSIVNVYRNPATNLELADPRRFDSLPPDSFARPIKRPPSPYLPRPPPPLFADARPNHAHRSFQAPVSHAGQFDARSQTPNKRRKLHAYGSGAYTTDPDHPIDSRELQHHGDAYTHTARHHPAQEPQVKDSQTSARNKRSDPYGTPLSSQITPHENGAVRETGMVSVPDSPQTRMTAYDRESLQPSSANSDSRSSSPELPSTLGRSPQLQEASNNVRSTELGLRSSHKALADSETKPAARASVNRKEISSLKEPDFLSQLEEAQRGAEAQEQTSDLPQTTQKTSHIGSSEIASEDSTTSKADSVRALPLGGRQLDLAPQSHGEPGKGGRLKRPNLLKSPRSLTGAPRLINGVRQKAPSITDVFDPIETSEGSSYERQVPRSLKRAKAIAPKKSLRKTALQKAASQDSLIVRLRLPTIMQPDSAGAPLPKAPEDNIQLDAKAMASPGSTQESRSAGNDSQGQDPSVEAPYLTTAGAPNDQSSDLENATTAFNPQAQKSTDTADLRSNSLSSGGDNQGKSIAALVRQKPFLPNEHPTDEADSSHAQDQETVDDSLARQVKEAQEVSEKAQAEFDRITALQKKRQTLQEPKANSSVAEKSFKLADTKQPASSAFGLSDASKAIYSSDDLEAKRKQGLEQLASTRNKYFKDSAAVDSSNAPSGTNSKPKKTEAQAKAKEEEKKKRRAREEKDRKVRMGIANKLEEENQRKKGAQDDAAATKMTNGKEEPAAKQRTKDVATPQRREDTVGEVTEIAGTSDDQASPELSKPTSKPLRTEDSARTRTAAEAGKSERGAERTTGPIEQAIRDSSRNMLAERSPKARLNATRQLQIANHALKYSNKDVEIIKAPATVVTPKVAKAPTQSSKAQQKPSAEQATKKTPGETKEPKSQGKGEIKPSTVYIDDAALNLARAAGGKSTTIAPKASDKARLGATKAKAIDLAAGESTTSAKEPPRQASSPSLTRNNEPSRARTMTPAIPSSYMQDRPNSAEARARRAASVNAKTLETPTRNALPGKATASRRSVSFAEDSVSQLHHRKSLDQEATPTPSDHTSRMNTVGKTPDRTKQTTLTKHVDRKLKGKVIDPPSPIRATPAKEIVISSESEASTFFSDESEGERSARAGPSSRKKSKPRDSSSVSASALPASKPAASVPTPKTNTQFTTENFQGELSRKPSQPENTRSGRVVQQLGVNRNSARERRRSTSTESTDDVSNLPPVRGLDPGRPKSPVRGLSERAHQISTPQNPGLNANASRMKDEERRQLEANEQLQREYSQAMQTKPTTHADSPSTDAESSEAESSSKVNQRPAQTRQPAVRSGHEKYGSRVRINPTYENLSLSQLMKAQAAEPKGLNGSAKSRPPTKLIGQPTVESSSASETEESSSSASVDLSKKAQGGPAPQKKRVLPSVWRDLYGREDNTSGKRYQ